MTAAEQPMTADLQQLAAGIANARTPLAGIITAGQPTAAQIDRLVRGGVRTIVDLRAASEPRGFDEPATIAAAGGVYHPVPVAGGAIGGHEFGALRALLRDAAARPMLVHCASANRVGAALIPWLVLDQGLSRDDALRVAHGVGLRSDELARAAFTYIDEEAARA